MSDYGEADFGDYDDEGNDWMYVEDYYDIADELAEYTCPSPGCFDHPDTGTYESDLYEYFADLEYLSDGGYYDSDEEKSKKRKSSTIVTTKPKRRRTTAASAPDPNDIVPVVWMSCEERSSLDRHASVLASGTMIGLLKDWRTRFANYSGLATFPKEDFHIEGDSTDEWRDENDVSETEEIEGDGFDLADIRKVAELIGQENMDSLQKIMEAQGLDPAAVQQVLRDMIEGKEREFGDEEEDDGEDDGSKEDAATETHIISPPVAPVVGGRGSARGGSSGRSSTPLPAGRSAHRAKRKERDEDEQDLEAAVVRTPAKRPKTMPLTPEPSSSAAPPPSRSYSFDASPGRRRGRGRRQ